MTVPVIVEHLTKRFGGDTAVSDLSFAVPRGSAAAVVGPAGAGKSTVLHQLLGLQQPTAGRADLGDAAPPREVGAVLTPRGLPPRRAARSHLRALAPVAGADAERVTEVLEYTGLTTVAELPIGELTSGQQTRLALAAALLGDPWLLLLDEPLTDPDPAEQACMADLLRAHHRRGGTLLLTSPVLAPMVPLVDQLIILSAGAAVWRGSPARLRRGHPDRLLVAATPAVALATALAARGWTDAVMRPDGRLAVAEATQADIFSAAQAAKVRIHAVHADPIHPDRVLASLTEPRHTLSGHTASHPTGHTAGFPVPPMSGSTR